MNRGKITIAAGVILSILILPSVSSDAFAQYNPSIGTTGMDDLLSKAKQRIALVEANPVGAGVPMFSADGVIGAVLITTAVFGVIAGAFFVKGTQGKYAAIGRG